MPDDQQAVAPAKPAKPLDRRSKAFKADADEQTRVLATLLKLRFKEGLSYEEITAQTGYSRYLIDKYTEPFRVIFDNPEAVKQFRLYEAELMDGLRMMMVNGMYTVLSDPKRIAKMDLSRFTYGFGIMYDKMRLERGESTANVKTLSDLIRSAHATEVEPDEAEIEQCEKPSPPSS